MRSLKSITLGLWLAALFALSLRAETFQLNNSDTITGEIIGNPNDAEIQVKIGEGEYKKISWSDLSQATLKQLAQNPKFLPHAEPFIEIPQADRVKKTAVPITQPPRLTLPAKGSLLGALFGSSVGLFCLFLIYAANLYAGYEVGVVRAYSPALTCGISAVAPVIGPIIFLCLPTHMGAATEASAPPPPPPAEEEPVTSSFAGDTQAAEHPSSLHFADQSHAAAAALPPTQVFQRGQFTFNRRFIETKFSHFFTVVRRDAEKDLVLLVKTPRGEFNVHRISRISANDLHAEVKKGPATSEVSIPFGEIQEIRLKHKDA
ncbi:MAG: hypothetical protein EXS35_13750 [Pedosphaera sp.]|nr:hypothetical protein [Pedosphaera sp.]